MPWWGWLLLLGVIALPLKLRVWKSMFAKNKENSSDF